jgi:hypothetical protein
VLLQRGAAPNARDFGRNTPLHLCPPAGGETVITLVRHGARLTDLPNNNKQDPAAGAGARAAPPAGVSKAQAEWLAAGAIPADGLELDADRDDPRWAADDAEPECRRCSAPFGFLRRRHHCRRCGVLCCGDCWSKTATRDAGRAPFRVCDGCYNVCRVKAAHAHHAAASAAAKKTDSAPVTAASARGPMTDGERRRAHDAEAASIKADIERLKKEGGSTRPQVEATKAAMAENKRLALERGEKLNEMGDKAARMEDAAQSFAAKAQRLKEQQKSSWW